MSGSDSGKRRAWRRCASLSPSRTRLCSPATSEDDCEDGADLGEEEVAQSAPSNCKPSSRVR